jgi:hypothetical protein
LRSRISGRAHRASATAARGARGGVTRHALRSCLTPCIRRL